MGVDLGDLIQKEEIKLTSLAGKRIAVDAFNTIYQFLSIIRQRDGTPLMDSDGNVTSHLSGMFYRTARILEMGILPCYVFDGKPPQLKAETIKERIEIKKEARKKWKEAVEREDMAKARRYAQQTSKLTKDMLEESKQLLGFMGIPVVEAPSEGEAQAAVMCQRGDVYASASQDHDSLLFGAPRLVKNMNITGKRKVPRKNIYIDVKPELIDLKSVLKEFEINREQLISAGVLIGTDFNPGIKGVGPKKALEIVRSKSEEEISKEFDFGVDFFEVRKIFLEPEVTKDYNLTWGEPNRDKLIELLHEKHEFSKERIENSLERIEKASHAKDQKSLDEFF